jgi:hypothetical protein
MTDNPLAYEGFAIHYYRALAINAYASLEAALCRNFGYLMGTKLDLAEIVFYSITNTHSRNRILDELITKKFGSEYEPSWNGVPGTHNKRGLFTYIRQLDQRRNEIVHWHVTMDFAATNPMDARYSLMKPAAYAVLERATSTISIPEFQAFIAKADFIAYFANMFSIIAREDDFPELPSLRDMFRQPVSYPPPDTSPLSPNYKEPQPPPQPFGT